MSMRFEVPGGGERFLALSTSSGRSVQVCAPVFPLGGQPVSGAMQTPSVDAPVALANGVVETRFEGTLQDASHVCLAVVVRHRPGASFLRFRYELSADQCCAWTADAERRAIYLELEASPDAAVTEVGLSQFDESIHSYRLTETDIPKEWFAAGLDVMGPVVTVEYGDATLLAAYEHGSTAPDAFLAFALSIEETARRMALTSVKANAVPGRDLAEAPFRSVWFQLGLVDGDCRACASAYRAFVLNDLSMRPASRRPYIYYNTWNFQERNKHWHGNAYLDSMRQERIVEEIDVAHRMGVDVFVLDTGWYAKTGEWAVNTERFDAELATVRRMLEDRGMKLGLWFSPTQAAVSSSIAQRHPDCRMEWEGRVVEPRPVWETETSTRMCLVSRWWRVFADELIRLHREVGVTYFKWDAVAQYGCDSPAHEHGTEAQTREERRDCCAFEQVRYMNRIVERVAEACPEAIVDFDVTEAGRSVGLAFLSTGKFFLVNNGPYYRNLDDPIAAPGGGMGTNVFVFPGPARPRNLRATLDMDRWIPSVLFLAHYLPDDPASSQEINIASMILGHNGIWGDLCGLSEDGIRRYGKWLRLYKQVRDAVTVADPVRTGIAGGTPEIHEKIDSATGCGAVCLFAPRGGRYRYVTRGRVDGRVAAMPGVQVQMTADRHAVLAVDLQEAGGKAVLFGVEPGTE